jgi:hypothetical protein
MPNRSTRGRAGGRRCLRLALTIAVLLMAGVLGSVLLAWGIAAREYLRTARQTGVITTKPELHRVPIAAADPFHARRVRRFGYESWTVERPLPVQLPPGETIVSPPTLPLSRMPPRWVALPLDEPGRGTANIAYGWPFRCVMVAQTRQTAETLRGRTTTMSNRGEYTIFRSASGRGIVLAYLPIWGGLIANTLLLAAAATLILVSLGPARRRLRARRGLCPCCAYDLLGHFAPGCPECGWKRAN